MPPRHTHTYTLMHSPTPYPLTNRKLEQVYSSGHYRGVEGTEDREIREKWQKQSSPDSVFWVLIYLIYRMGLIIFAYLL